MSPVETDSGASLLNMVSGIRLACIGCATNQAKWKSQGQCVTKRRICCSHQSLILRGCVSLGAELGFGLVRDVHDSGKFNKITFSIKRPDGVSSGKSNMMTPRKAVFLSIISSTSGLMSFAIFFG